LTARLLVGKLRGGRPIDNRDASKRVGRTGEKEKKKTEAPTRSEPVAKKPKGEN